MSRRSTLCSAEAALTYTLYAVQDALAMMAARIASAMAVVATNPPATRPCRTLWTILPLGSVQFKRTWTQLGTVNAPGARPGSLATFTLQCVDCTTVHYGCVGVG